ncbi:MAG: hypothetical protein AB1649_18980 [Chloroflexota bacterium]
MQIEHSAIGLLSIADQLLRVSHWGVSWYILSLLFFVGMFIGRKKTAWLAIPAAITAGIGLGMSLYSLTHHWKMMFYFWSVLIWFVGAGICIMGWKIDNAAQKLSALRVMKTGLFLSILFGTFFEMLFSRMAALAFPALLVMGGISVILSRSRRSGSKQNLPSALVASANSQSLLHES